MQEAIGDHELLTLSLGTNHGTTAAAWAGKKRKARDAMRADDDDDDDGQFLRLLQGRDGMARKKLDVSSRRVVTSGAKDGNGGLQVVHLLLASVAALEVRDTASSAAALRQLYKRASFHGDPVQRVAAHFAEALASRLLGSPAVAAPRPTASRAEEFAAFTMFYQASPYYQFAHFTANQAIIEAFEDDEHRHSPGRRRLLHVIDFDVSYGFQWPSLIQSLSDIATTTGKPISLRITGFGSSSPALKETEARLAHFASGCLHLSFEFEGIVRGSPSSGYDDQIQIDDAATVAANLSSREASATTLAYVQSLKPSLVFLMEHAQEADLLSAGHRSLLPRFMAYLRYFAAMFDSLDECLPTDSLERLDIERNHLGREMKRAMAACEEEEEATTALDEKVVESTSTSSSSRSSGWKERMERNGFEGVKLSSRTVSQAKLLLKIKSRCSGGFRVVEGGDGRAMSLGWRDEVLVTASGWRCRRR